ncbi:polysaccharide biosynthesis protein [Bacteroides stercorirosoris]|uniref:NDP-sugar epimerase, includes UDP-GlcNAc-inverting 4,6-dehydratase FlaA1 and capsular polysaccharide biosynthesis protein EpsC n=1 Tax=Bacteroides stercorirosoris TaxID=871324 RepID=A0A1M6IPT5_9BACE|nr:nucleoside-diphosphate sugar epimerase/dehydratase [Bacteroides stercorirosoris]SHJ36369.1 NDP-sugar epimerase, includes UDP-GlcNAc-inverting 4,6-dehydratase FlaA1 and capsular polysaccharide biosynthesis protein EpsC [Bacteroides stercorirosoris]
MKHKIIHRYLSSKVLPIWTILLIDVLIIVVSSLLAYALRYDFRSIFLESSTIDKTIVWTVIVNLIFFRIFRTYSNVLRFSSFIDIMRIFVSLTVSYALLMISSVLLASYMDIRLAPVSVLFMAYIISFAMMSCSRIVVKMFYELLNFDGSHSANVFIYGAKEAGVNIAKALRVNLRNHYRLRGFIADEPELINKVMMGVKVFPNDESLIDVLSDRDVHTIIISPAKMEELKKSGLADRLLANNIKMMTAPPLSEWNGQTLNRTQLKEIQIEDLLQRNPIEIDIHKVASHLEGKRVMITGAAGSIGSEIMRQVASFNPYKLILIDQAETPLHDIRLELQDRWRDIDAETIIADISNATRMEGIFKEYQPQYIFHAAAYKHVPMMEDNVSESIQINVFGTRTLADLAVKYGAEKFVMISTDKAVNPTNVMGCSKRICEIYVQSLAKKLQKEGGHVTQFITTRFGNVLGSNGSVIPRFRDQIQRGGPVTVTHPEIIRYFMTIPEACRLVLEAGSMGNGGEIYIFDMGKPVKIVDLAKRMISLSGRTDVKIEFTGLRHGEKLYEELLNVKELTKPTYHEKIMIATVREYDYDEVKERIQKLIEVSYTYDQMKIVSAMKDIVPEFISKNSCFEALDKKAE